MDIKKFKAANNLVKAFVEQKILVETTDYTAFHKYVPEYGIAVYVVVEKNV